MCGTDPQQTSSGSSSDKHADGPAAKHEDSVPHLIQGARRSAAKNLTRVVLWQEDKEHSNEDDHWKKAGMLDPEHNNSVPAGGCSKVMDRETGTRKLKT
jgi:hypothetical protein